MDETVQNIGTLYIFTLGILKHPLFLLSAIYIFISIFMFTLTPFILGGHLTTRPVFPHVQNTGYIIKLIKLRFKKY